MKRFSHGAIAPLIRKEMLHTLVSKPSKLWRMKLSLKDTLRRVLECLH